MGLSRHLRPALEQRGLLVAPEAEGRVRATLRFMSQPGWA